MEHFRNTYPIDRQRRLDDMIQHGWIDQTAVALLDMIAERYGCIAYDLGMFPTGNDGEIQLTWNVAIEDIRDGGRKRNTTIASMIITTTGVTFQDGKSGNPVEKLSWEDQRLTDVIEFYRTCRT